MKYISFHLFVLLFPTFPSLQLVNLENFAIFKVLCSFDLLFNKISRYRLIYFANIYCCFTWLEMGFVVSFINESGGCLASANLLELLLSHTEMISYNFLLVCP